jgi:hypothetical protein
VHKTRRAEISRTQEHYQLTFADQPDEDLFLAVVLIPHNQVKPEDSGSWEFHLSEVLSGDEFS